VPGIGGRIYNIGGGGQITLNEGIVVIEECVGHRLELQRAPAQAGDVRDTSADTTRAQRDLGLVGTVPFHDGLQRQFVWAAGERVTTPPA
jgi:UDP-glucuronate 4-epimerase